MNSYRLTGNGQDEIILSALDDTNALSPYAKSFALVTGIRHYQFGHVLVTFTGFYPSIVTFTGRYDGFNFRLTLEKCDGFRTIAGSGGPDGNDWAEVHGDVKSITVEEYIHDKFFQKLY